MGNIPNLFISSSSVKSDNVLTAIKELSIITRNIELSGGNDHQGEIINELIDLKNNHNYNFLFHNYFPPPQTHFLLNFANNNIITRNFIRQSMDCLKALKLNYYSIHSGFKKEFQKKGELLYPEIDHKEYTIDDINGNLSWFQSEFPGTQIALENMFPNNEIKECGIMMTIDEIDSFMKKFPDIYLLLDLGHLNITSLIFNFDFLNGVEFLFKKYENRIKEIHISGNRGINDIHSIIDKNNLQFFIIKKYIEIINKNKILLTIESRDTSVEKLNECYRLFADLLYFY